MDSTTLTRPIDKQKNIKLLVVGAGGIGCEILKNLVNSGFVNLHVIDLDTIDISNLNRQFLFRKEHVGKSKSQMAVDVLKSWFSENEINAVAHHGNVMDSEFGPSFIKQFDAVLNALDNVDTRRHVNRLCITANVPLIESGSAGYLGQAHPILKGETECYECSPKPTPKRFPVCTIRSNPSKPIHCVVWAKYVLTRLFGEESDDNAVTSFGEKGAYMDDGITVNINHVFDTVFGTDVAKLAKVEDLWKLRPAPRPMYFSDNIPDIQSENSSGLSDERVWTLKECRDVFQKCCNSLSRRDRPVEFDKDDDVVLDFVTAATGLREYCFNIDISSRFEVKSIAGSIVPAIASTNAIVAGLAVLELIKVLSERTDLCKLTYVLKIPSNGRLLIPVTLDGPNSKCFACGNAYAEILVNTKYFKMREFVNRVLKGELSLIFPTITIGSSEIYTSGEDLDEEETADNESQLDKTMDEIGLGHNATMLCEDFAQNFKLKITVVQCNDFEFPDEEYELSTANENREGKRQKV